MSFRDYDHERDLAAVQRIWREIGWIDDSDGQKAAVAAMYAGGRTIVADIDDTAECAVHRTAGTIRHGAHDLPMGAITAVATSHVARKQGMAHELTTETLACIRDEGAAVATLGIFEQGFYDRFGFGSGPYNHRITYDPSTLRVPFPDRPPVRVGIDDVDDVHALQQRRHRSHGGVTFAPRSTVESELGALEKPFGLGFRADDGRLTHALLGSMLSDKHYRVDWIAYEEPAQLLELLGVCRALGDQLVALTFSFQPAEIQLQDLVDAPIRQRNRSGTVLGGTGPAASHNALCWYQARIVDLQACIGALQWVGPPVSFDLALTDPLAARGGRWPGLGGEYHVRVAEESQLTQGHQGAPTLTASVNALSRLWLGGRSATSLALTDDLAGPPELLADLDVALRLPEPHPGWMF